MTGFGRGDSADVRLGPPAEPMYPPGQGDYRGKRSDRHQGGRPLSGDPLEPDQQRQLPLHALGQAQRMSDKAKHRHRGLLLARERPGVAIGWIGDNGPAALGNCLAGQEVHTGRAKAAIRDIRGRDVVAAPLQHVRDGAAAATRFPHPPPELNMTKKRLSDPVRSGVEIAGFAIVTRNVDGAAMPGLGARARLARCNSATVASLRLKRSRTSRGPSITSTSSRVFSGFFGDGCSQWSRSGIASGKS